MGLFPIFMNIIQFWVIDSIIKVGGVGGLSTPSEEPDEAADHEPLFNDHDSDEEEDDEDGGEAAKRDVEAQTTTATTQRLRHSADSTHTYPPSLPGSPTATPATIRYSSVSPPTLSRSLPLVKRRRSSPAPLRLPGLDSHSLPSRAGESAGVRMKEDWQAWDREEDWSEHVGEEDPMGQRAGEGS
jgi:hypothetical protein